MAFKISDYYNQYKDYYGEASLEDVAKDIYDRGGHANQYKDFETFKKTTGMDAEIQADNEKRRPKSFMDKLSEGVASVAPGLEEIPKGLSAGVQQVRGMGYGLGALAGEVTGAEGLKKWGAEGLKDVEAKTPKAAVGSFSEIENVSDLGKYLAYGVSSNLPNMAISLATGGVGGLAGKTLAKGAIEKATAGIVEKEVAKKVAQDIAKKYLTRGAVAGAATSSIGMEAGSIAGDQLNETGKVDPLRAMAGAIPAGLLDVVPEWYLAKKLGWIGKGAHEFKGNLPTRIAKVAGAQFAMEAPTEAVQSAIERASVPGKSITNAEAWDEYINSFILGGVTGGVVGAAGGVFAKGEQQKETREAKKTALSNTIDEGLKNGKLGEEEFTPGKALGIIKSGLDEGIFSADDISEFRKYEKDHPEFKTGLDTISNHAAKNELNAAVDAGIKNGNIGGVDVAPDDILKIIAEYHGKGLYTDDDLNNFKEQYPILKTGLNDVLVESAKKKVNDDVPLYLGPEDAAEWSARAREVFTNAAGQGLLPPGQGFTFKDVDYGIPVGEPYGEVDVIDVPSVSREIKGLPYAEPVKQLPPGQGFELGEASDIAYPDEFTRKLAEAPEIKAVAPMASIGQESEGSAGASGIEPGGNLEKAPHSLTYTAVKGNSIFNNVMPENVEQLRSMGYEITENKPAIADTQTVTPSPVTAEAAQQGPIKTTDDISFPDDISPYRVSKIWDDLYSEHAQVEEKVAESIKALNDEKNSLPKGDRSGRIKAINKQIADLKEEVAISHGRIELVFQAAMEEYAKKIIARARTEGITASDDEIYDVISELSNGRAHDSNGGKTWDQPLAGQVIEYLKPEAAENPPNKIERRGQTEKAAFIRNEVEINSVKERMAGRTPDTVQLVKKAEAEWNKTQGKAGNLSSEVKKSQSEPSSKATPETPVNQGIAEDRLPEGAKNKETWQMTKAEAVNDAANNKNNPLRREAIDFFRGDENRYKTVNGKRVYEGPIDKEIFDKIRELHEGEVEMALNEGKPVPPEVLKDYPELNKSEKKQSTSAAVAATTGLKKGKVKESDRLAIVHKFIAESISNPQKTGTEAIRKVNEKEANDIKKLTGYDVSTATHEVTANDLRHMLAEHGDKNKEISRGQIAITVEDLNKIPDIIDSYDKIEPGATDARGRKSIRYIKKENGTITYVEVLLKKGKVLSSKTMWKTPSGSVNATNNPDNTSKTAAGPGVESKVIPSSEKIKAENEPVNIQDFGEKIGGARKDLAQSLSRQFSDEDIAAQPLSQIWPVSELKNIEDTYAAAVAFAARAEIPAKPRTSYKLKRWVEQVKKVRELAQKVLSGQVTREKFAEAVSSYPGLQHFNAKVTLLEALDREQWNRIGQVEEWPDAYMWDDNGKKISSPTVYVAIDGKLRSFEAQSISDIIDKVKEVLGVDVAEKKIQFELRGRPGAYFINKKGDPEYRKLKTFSSLEEASKYKKENYDDLVAAWEEVKERDNVKQTDVRRLENRPRTSKDYRNGKDITPQQFNETFGFRGVEFGNWVSQGKNLKERQGMLNEAYDAMMDLANILDIPPKAISLNGELGLGFGSRGSGSSSAHYESDKIVINLTKTRGAGTLAHEWFHALDNYFQRVRGITSIEREGRFITYNPEIYYQDAKSGARIPEERYNRILKQGGIKNPENWTKNEVARPEVVKAFGNLVKALDESPMAKRAAKIKNPYWGRIIERAARSFENYVIVKMNKQGYQNDYLANIIGIEDFKRDAGRYPYLFDNEIAPVEKAFDKLFETIETKETDKGVALYDRTTEPSHGIPTARIQSIVDKVTSTLSINPKINVVQHVSECPDAVLKDMERNGILDENGDADVQGFAWRGETWLVGDNLDSDVEAFKVLMHELTHNGLGALLNDNSNLKSVQWQYNNLMDKIISAHRRDIMTIARTTHTHLNLNTIEGRRQAAEEWLCNQSYEAQHKWYDKLITIFNNLVRAMGLDIKLSDSEVRIILREAFQTFEGRENDVRYMVAAWHGSQKQFDKFSSQKIKTGNYGHGLYFSSMREVAEQYKEGGHLYQVTLAPDESDFLDWDRPIDKQSKYVQDVLNNSAIRHILDAYEDAGGYVDTGKDVYFALMKEQGSAKAASQLLSDYGIAGNKYVDSSQGETGQNYVLFDDRNVNIEVRYARKGEDATKTDNFKKWFGDWESAAKYKSLQSINTIEIKSEATDKKTAEITYNGLGEATNKQDNKIIRFVKATFGKLAGHKQHGLLFRIIPQAKELMETALPIYSEAEKSPEIRTNVVAYYNYLSKVLIDGKEYYVRFTVRGIKDKRNEMHNAFISDIDIIKADTKSNGLTDISTSGNAAMVSLVDNKLSAWIAKVKNAYDKSSKVVDKSGTPLKMYHGSNASNITSFKTTDKDGIYFSSNREYSGGYADAKAKAFNGKSTIYEAYLSIKNPLIVNGENEQDWERYTQRGFDKEELQKQGYDGIIVKYDDGEIEAQVFSANQIKSAIGNNGNFDAENPDIRYSRTGKDPIIKQREIGKGEEKRTAPAVHQSDFETLQAMPELRVKPLGGWLENPIRTFEELGAEAKELFYRPVKEAEHKAKVEFKAIHEQSEKIRKSLSRKASERIGIYALAQQKDGKEILASMKIDDVPKLDAKEMKAYEWMRENLEEYYEKLQAARKAAGKEGFGKVENYFTFARQFSLAEKLGFSPIFTRSELLNTVMHRKTTSFKYEKHRTGGMSRADLDAFGVFNRYMESATRHVALSPAIAKGREMLLTFKEPGPNGEETNWLLRDEKPAAAKFITEWLDFQAGQRKPQLPNLIEKGLTTLNKNLAFAILSANIRSALIQPSAIVNTFAEIGPKWTFEGIKGMMDDTIINKSNVLLSRQFDVNISETMAGLPGRFGRVKQTIGNIGMKPLQFLDMITARATWQGAYKKAISEGMDEATAANYADDVVTKTQGSAMPSDMAPVQRTALGKSVTMFQTFVINQWGFLTKDVLGINNTQISKKEAARKIITFVAFAILFNMFYEDLLEVPAPLPSPISAFVKALDKGESMPSASADAAREIASIVPIVGGGLRYGSSPFGAPVEYVTDIFKKMSPNYSGPTRSVPELIGKGLGIPGTTQATKIARVEKKGGSLLDMALGRYDSEHDPRQIKKSLVRRLRNKDAAALADMRKYYEEGKLTKKEVKAIRDEASVPEIVWKFKRLSLDEAIEEYKSASAEEKKLLRPVLKSKMHLLSELAPEPRKKKVVELKEALVS